MRQKRHTTPLILSLVALILAGVTWQQGGIPLTLLGIQRGGKFLLRVLLLLIAAFLTAGMIQALVSKEMVTRWLGAGSGWRGLSLACLGGALIPGGPYVYYPIAGALLNTGAGIGVLVSFVTAKNLWSVSRLPMEFALLGSNLTLIRYGITFIVPLILGYLAETFFGRYIEQIREGIQS
jgi:uncharacterized membrane protein YraQ (UPF0718 family)